MKKRIWVLLICTMVLAGCKGKENDSKEKTSTPPTVKAEKTASAATKAPTTAPTSTPVITTAIPAPTVTPAPAASVAPSAKAVKNVLVLMDTKQFTGIEGVKSENYDDASYFYEDMLSTDNATASIINQCVAKSKFEAKSGEELAKECIGYMTKDETPFKIKVYSDEDYSKQFTYPTYLCSWNSGENESSTETVALIVDTENFVFAYSCNTSLDHFEDLKDTFYSLFDGLRIEEIGK